MAVLIAGTFLPWVVSGQVRRNSYEFAGLVQQLGVVSGVAALLARGLPFLGPMCMVPVLVAVLGWRRSAGVLSVIVGVLVGGGSTALLILASGRSAMGVALDPLGPTTVIIGAALLTAAGVFLVLRPASPAVVGDPGARR